MLTRSPRLLPRRLSCFGGEPRFGAEPRFGGKASGEVSVTHEHPDGVAEIHAVVALLEGIGEVRLAFGKEDAAEAGGLWCGPGPAGSSAPDQAIRAPAGGTPGLAGAPDG